MGKKDEMYVGLTPNTGLWKKSAHKGLGDFEEPEFSWVKDAPKGSDILSKPKESEPVFSWVQDMPSGLGALKKKK